MASLRRLRRRLLRWKRYAAKATTGRGRYGWEYRWPNGHVRAMLAVNAEEERRFWAETPEVWLGGPEGEQALIADDRCCLAGNACHDGPCVVRCEGCTGNSRCPECGGVDDLGCWYCEGTGCCPRYCDDGEILIEEHVPRPPYVVTEHAFTEKELL